MGRGGCVDPQLTWLDSPKHLSNAARGFRVEKNDRKHSRFESNASTPWRKLQADLTLGTCESFGVKLAIKEANGTFVARRTTDRAGSDLPTLLLLLCHWSVPAPPNPKLDTPQVSYVGPHTELWDYLIGAIMG